MKFYENMNPIERKIMILKAVRESSALEGMKAATQVCTQEIQKLQPPSQSSAEKSPVSTKR